jgi:branched-subunit amino acid ABC-type transport system permease component
VDLVALLAIQVLYAIASLALISVGLAIIFGMMRVINFAHGAFYMLGAFGAYVLLQQTGIGFWPALLLVPCGIALLGMVLERTLVRRLYNVDPLYNFLLTFGVALVLQDAMRLRFGIQGQPYAMPAELREMLLKFINKSIHPYVRDRGLDWEIHIDDTPRDQWTIQGMRPPDSGSEEEKRWIRENRPSKPTPSAAPTK